MSTSAVAAEPTADQGASSSRVSPERTNEKPEASKMIGQYTEEFLLERARELVTERTENWELTTPGAEDRIPKFERDGE